MRGKERPVNRARYNSMPARRRSRGWSAGRALAGLVVAGLLVGDLGPAARADERELPPDPYAPFVVIKAGRIITNTGPDIRDGIIVVSAGKVHQVGRNLEYPLNARVIDARDRAVMPGMIDPHSRYGLLGYSRSGIHGDLAVADEYYPPVDDYEELLDSGFTALALIPAGRDIPGRALVTRIAGPEDERELLSPAYLRVAMSKAELRSALDKAQAEIDKVEKARKEFEQKQAEAAKQAEQQKKEAEQKQEKKSDGEQKSPTTQPTTQPATQPAFEPPPIDPKLQPLVDLLQEKDIPGLLAVIELDQASDVLHVNDVLEDRKLAHAFLLMNYRQSDFGLVAEALGGQKARVIMVPRVGRTPYTAERDPLPWVLSQAGCEVSLTPLFENLREYRRTLPRLAELTRLGWSREAAIKSVTLHPARLLGIDDRFGTIEEGKVADLIFLDADPLDPTAKVREVMIAGEIVHRAEEFE
jgi:hypothetical protein